MTIPDITPEDLLWTAMAVYFEASGEPRQGQKAVVKIKKIITK